MFFHMGIIWEYFVVKPYNQIDTEYLFVCGLLNN